MRFKTLVPVLASAALLLNLDLAQATTCGTAAFNHAINWYSTPALSFAVTGAPASTCGDLWSWRNGSGYYLESANWICTDPSGQATKGTWSAAGRTTDETSYHFIDWHSCTSPEVSHIWDVEWPDPSISSGYPSTFSGTASDPGWGAGFSSSWGSYCETEFYDGTPGVGKWWNFGTGTWTGTSPSYGPCFLSGLPGYNISWYATNLPTGLVSGHHYFYKVLVWDALNGNQGIQTVDFWY
jgi:hypothetical protein